MIVKDVRVHIEPTLEPLESRRGRVANDKASSDPLPINFRLPSLRQEAHVMHLNRFRDDVEGVVIPH